MAIVIYIRRYMEFLIIRTLQQVVIQIPSAFKRFYERRSPLPLHRFIFRTNYALTEFSQFKMNDACS
jgi:hypothetical protein